MATLWNPTTEDLSYSHNKIWYEIKAGGTLQNVPDKAANHLLTHLSNRGLVSLSFEDANDPSIMDRKKKAALTAQEKFEIGQIQEHNRINKMREGTKQRPATATDQLDRFARRWGIDLNKPFTEINKDKEVIGKLENRAIEAESESKSLKEEVGKLSEMVSHLMRENILRNRVSKLDKRTADYKDIQDLIDTGKYAEAEERLSKLNV